MTSLYSGEWETRATQSGGFARLRNEKHKTQTFRHTKRRSKKRTMMYARALDWAHQTQKPMQRMAKGGPQKAVAVYAAAGVATTAGLIIMSQRHAFDENAIQRHSTKLEQSLDFWRRRHVVACSANEVGGERGLRIALVSQSGDSNQSLSSALIKMRDARLRSDRNRLLAWE